MDFLTDATAGELLRYGALTVIFTASALIIGAFIFGMRQGARRLAGLEPKPTPPWMGKALTYIMVIWIIFSLTVALFLPV